MDDKTKIRKFMTHKSGPFRFSREFENENIRQANFEAAILYETIRDLPILPDMSSKLDEELIIRSIFGTAAIEGNPLEEPEVENILSGSASPKTTTTVQQEILNLKKAYDFVDKEVVIGEDLQLSEDVIKKIHILITDGIDYGENVPGKYRNHRVEVGNADHGGVHVPPKIHDDIQDLMGEFIDWINSEDVRSCPFAVFGRAALAHYHLGLIHPFFDGNGRTARLVEGMLLKAAGIEYVPRMLSNYYYKNVDDYYWAFSKSIKSKTYDISPFMEFVFNGVVESLRDIKGRIIFHIRVLFLREFFALMRSVRELTQRQHDLLMILLDDPEPFTRADLFIKPPLRLLYRNVSERTAARDIKKLVDMGLLVSDSEKNYTINYAALD